jgi:hypothetical protein
MFFRVLVIPLGALSTVSDGEYRGFMVGMKAVFEKFVKIL